MMLFKSALVCWFMALYFPSSRVNGAVNMDICLRFPQMTACATILQQQGQAAANPSAPGVNDVKYCSLACEQDKCDVLNSACDCGTTTTTTTKPATTTTAEPPGHCYYTLNRPPQLGTVTKRLFQGSPVIQNCQYPGLVGIFREPNIAICMGSLLDEETVLLDAICYSFIMNYRVKALVDSYVTSDISQSNIEPVFATAASLGNSAQDPSAATLVTMKLTPGVTFDDTCVQPACFSNTDIDENDIDFDDCRFVGYGDTRSTYPGDTTYTPVDRLMEVEVTIDRSSLTQNTLVARRKDNAPPLAGPCMNDFGSPLICSHLVTHEWITVGMTSQATIPCETGDISEGRVENLLRSAPSILYFNSLQLMKYTTRP